jgi:hypothetical protein
VTCCTCTWQQDVLLTRPLLQRLQQHLLLCEQHLLGLQLLHGFELAPAKWDALAPSSNVHTSSQQHIL